MAYAQAVKVSFTYPGETEPAVKEVSFTLEKGTLTALCGATGSGKSTLLRLLKRALIPVGELKGQLFVDGVELGSLSEQEAAFTVGYVAQRPEEQIVTDKVWHELAFGLENMGLPQPQIAARVAETAAYFGMESWFDRPVDTLSGGQKQLLNLAAVMVMRPSLLLLDEPTAQLDPIAAGEFLQTVHRLNRELGLTVLVIEHRLEELVPLCDQLLVLDHGRLLLEGEPRQVAAALRHQPELLCAMPCAARLFHALEAEGDCPLSIREGRRFLESRYPHAPRTQAASGGQAFSAPPALEVRNLCFRYERNAPDVLRDVTLTVAQGEICCLLGGNGSGKSTLLSVAAGLNEPVGGTVKIFGRKVQSYRHQSLYRECVAMLPQDVQTLFLASTVEKELTEGGRQAQEVASLLPVDLSPLMHRHPYDLSGGEQQLVALAKALAQKPRLLLLDEPTKGVDAWSKRRLAQILHKLKQQGMTLLVVTHDVEFAALCADRCLMLFRGEIAAEGTPAAFFGGNLFYTTPVSRMTKGWRDGVYTVEGAAALCRQGAQGQ